ncbi:CrcB protein [Lysobacter dokdonensis DS-58]|uniref:Fluoride-specific ion channel FluC n=1 Tax=Lysobacter dokdonensis DS-58 TaxID=1300345 RepID=A0A0A2WL99_9GAMM|nr:fluoride efflux transporter CrcB [Lysobacter dokdonensis]KGQ19040.1 CrcB protein [Lysobacter dokdonensis DS-58]
MSSWWTQLMLVMAGGALGAAGRFWVGGAMLRRFGDSMPWGTLTANLVGAYLVGFIAVWLEARGPSALYWRAFVIVGFLGGLTTYSALMLECLLFARSHRSDQALLYLGVTLVAGLVLVWLGARTATWIRPPY